MPRRSSSRRNPATASGTPRSRAGDCTRTLTRASLAFLHGFAAEKEGREELVPLVALVEREHRIDDLVLELVERAVHQPACRNAISAFQDYLALFGEHELGEKQRRVRVRNRDERGFMGGRERGVRGIAIVQCYGVELSNNPNRRSAMWNTPPPKLRPRARKDLPMSDSDSPIR